MAVSPNTDNYTLGKGVVFFDQKDQATGELTGERDLGNAPAFSFNIALEKLEHFSSRGGLKAKDKEIISQITPGLSFTLDEINKENLALLTLAELNVVVAATGDTNGCATPAATVLSPFAGKRTDLAARGIEMAYVCPYDAGTALFVQGEDVTATGSGAEGYVISISAGAAVDDGTLIIASTNGIAFAASDVLAGTSGTGACTVSSEVVVQSATIVGLILSDLADTVFYEYGVDYTVDLALKDDVIGRVQIVDGGGITPGTDIHAHYNFDAPEYTEVQAFKETQIEGKLRFVSDNPAGTQQELEVWRCSLTPSGDTAMIGDDWSTLGFTGEILKDETGHPDSPYMNIIIA